MSYPVKKAQLSTPQWNKILKKYVEGHLLCSIRCKLHVQAESDTELVGHDDEDYRKLTGWIRHYFLGDILNGILIFLDMLIDKVELMVLYVQSPHLFLHLYSKQMPQ